MTDEIEIIAPTEDDAAITIGGVAAVGPPGADGAGSSNNILNGTGAPSAGLGNDGYFYIDTSVWNIYGPKTAGAWGSATALIGPAGADGADGADGTNGTNGTNGSDGAAGADGKTVLSGTGAPSGGTGSDGDFYIDTAVWTIYGPKSGSWPSGTTLVGPAGSDGADGADGAAGADGNDGAAGADGADGSTVLNGTAVPTTEGVDGDFYIRTSDWTIYGPKSGGGWGSATSLVGAAGADGSNGTNGTNGTNGSDGADGKTVLNGTVDPTTEGVDGDFYINTTSDTIFGPKTGGAWGSGTSLVGPAGGSDLTSDTEPTAADNTVKAYRYDLAGDHDSPAWINGDGAIIIPERSEIMVRKSAIRPRLYGGINNHGFLNPGQWGTKTEPNQSTEAYDGTGFENYGRVEIANSGSNNTVGDYYQNGSGGVFIAKGFVYSMIFANLTGMDDAEARAFIGLSSLIGTTHSGGSEPGADHASWVNFAGLTKQSGDSNWQFRHKNGTQAAATSIDLGANFPANTNDTDMYRLTLIAKAGEANLHYRVDRLNTGHSSVGKITTDLPDDETYLGHHFWFSTGNPGASLSGAIFGVYAEQAWYEGEV